MRYWFQLLRGSLARRTEKSQRRALATISIRAAVILWQNKNCPFDWCVAQRQPILRPCIPNRSYPRAEIPAGNAPRCSYEVCSLLRSRLVSSRLPSLAASRTTGPGAQRVKPAPVGIPPIATFSATTMPAIWSVRRLILAERSAAISAWQHATIPKTAVSSVATTVLSTVTT